jgi:hypothetical protein
MPIPESISALIATGPHVHLTTLNTDGSREVGSADRAVGDRRGAGYKV